MKIHELSISERIVLAEKLWDSIIDESAPIEMTEKQKFELDHRLQAFLDDQDVGSPWAEVKERIIGNI
ncbi:MAG: addiction module protein [Methylococcaceae bacterium]|jgi:putative addiction module component (TIGR02574 family)